MTQAQIESVAEAVFAKANLSILNRVTARSGEEEDEREVRKILVRKFQAAVRS